MKIVKIPYQYISKFLRTKLTRMQFIMVIATLTGLASGLIAVLLKSLVHFLQHLITEVNVTNLTFLLFPTIGLLVTVLIIQLFLVHKLYAALPWYLKILQANQKI